MAKCDTVPLPDEALLSLSGLALAYCTKSLKF